MVCICPLSCPDGVAWGSSSVVGVSVPHCTRWTLPCKGAGAERMHPQNLAQRLAPAVTIKVVALITVVGGDNARIMLGKTRIPNEETLCFLWRTESDRSWLIGWASWVHLEAALPWFSLKVLCCGPEQDLSLAPCLLHPQDL